MKKIIRLIIFAGMLYLDSYGKEENKLLPVQQIIAGLQENHEIFYPVNLFTSPEQRTVEGLGSYIHYMIDKNELKKAFDADYESIKLVLPQPGGSSVNLLLTQHQVLTDDFKFMGRDERGEFELPTPAGLYYYGMIEGYNQRSMVACSIFGNEVACVIGDESGNWNLGPLKDRDKLRYTDENEYAYYNDKAFHIPFEFICSTKEGTSQGEHKDSGSNSLMTNQSQCVQVAFVADQSFYAHQGSNNNNVFNYILSIFNVEATLYGNENVSVAIYRIYIAYGNSYASAASASDALSDFDLDLLPGGAIGPIGGDIQHLLVGASLGGGSGYVDQLCNLQSHAAQGLIFDFQSFPVYSDDANIVTHEDGHVIGSYHTHHCSWNGGNNTKIDDCGTHAGYPEGTCGPNIPDPVSGGTVMSYCHLRSVGINLVNGFGTQPGNLIRDNVYNASCLPVCNPTCRRLINVATPIISGSNVQFNASKIMSGNSTVESGATAIFSGGDSVILRPGFHSLVGSDFTAVIAPCVAPKLSSLTSQSLSGSPEGKGDLMINPNPFKSTFELSINLTQNEKVMINIFNPLGSKVKTITEQILSKGINRLSFDCGDLAPGVYMLILQSSDGTQAKKIIKAN